MKRFLSRCLLPAALALIAAPARAGETLPKTDRPPAAVAATEGARERGGEGVTQEHSAEAAGGAGLAPAPPRPLAPSPSRARKSLLATLLQEAGGGAAPSGGEGSSGQEGGGGGVRWSGSGELLWWGRVGGTFSQGIFADRTENSQFKVTHFHPKLSASLGRRGSAYIEGCVTHPRVGTQAEQAWVEYSAGEKLNLQGGRILVPFGHWNVIHDVYDHKTISYPLMYVGHEETEVELLGGPAPILSTGYSDIGALLYGSIWLSGDDQLWYGGYAVNGRFGTGDIEWLDLWNNQEDNNSNKALGGRLVYSRGDNLTLGTSYQTGRFDPENRLRYQMTGFDVYYRIADRYNLRVEWVRNPVDSTERGYTKTGWYAMLDFPLSPRDELVVSVAGLRRHPAQRVENVAHYTVGVNRRLTNSLKLKTELSYLRIGNFVGDPTDTDGDALFGTDFDDVVRVKASLVAIF